ncbi:MAG: helix-turn-helix domain-containing protein [Oscillospiraceae bacterium]|nr:helix-turn-helix domain-containing protein [Oscillospiraceae bacterium]
MNQQKTGEFLKHLRKEKGLTQEQLAEQFYVSSRTVSRWETGSNMPDLEILIELADFYNTDIREIIDGKRRSENMDSETKETLLKVAEYADAEKRKLKSKMLNFSIGTFIFLVIFCLSDTGVFNFLPIEPNEHINNFLRFFSLGIAAAALGLNILYLCGFLDKAREYKLKIFCRNK